VLTKHFKGEQFFTVLVKVREVDDEDFIVSIRKESRQTGEWIKTPVYTTRQRYIETSVGDWFTVETNDCSLTDDHEVIFLE